MNGLDILIVLFVLYGLYCLKNIKKDYEEYKKTKHYLEFNIFIRNLGVIIGSIVLVFYKIVHFF